MTFFVFFYLKNCCFSPFRVFKIIAPSCENQLIFKRKGGGNYLVNSDKHVLSAFLYVFAFNTTFRKLYTPRTQNPCTRLKENFHWERMTLYSGLVAMIQKAVFPSAERRTRNLSNQFPPDNFLFIFREIFHNDYLLQIYTVQQKLSGQT